MRFVSPLITEGRGSLGGTTWSRDRSGSRISARVAPIQQQTPAQTAVRSGFATAAAAWATLDAPTRALWDAAASTLTVTSSLGVTRPKTGYIYFSTCWRNQALIGQTPPPIVPNNYIHQPEGTAAPPAFITTSGTLTSAYAVLTVAWFDWANSSIVQFTRGLSPGKSYIPRTAYRSLQSHGSFSGTDLDVLTAYLALFPSPHPGQTIACRIRYVDQASGWSGIWQYAQSTVTGT